MIPLLAQAGIAGSSPAMEQIATLIAQVADTDLSVMITGESGSGKELIARAIHDNSSRRKNRLVTVNCGAIPEGIFESEVFGHERGAFTGAERLRKGMFELADGGYHLPGRNRRNAADDAGQDPARTGNRRVHARGRTDADSCGCTRCRGHQP